MTANIRLIIETIEGQISNSIAIFYYNKFSPILNASLVYENAKSELAAKQNISSLAINIESIDDERKVSSDIRQNKYYCDGCLLMSFDLNTFLNFFV